MVIGTSWHVKSFCNVIYFSEDGKLSEILGVEGLITFVVRSELLTSSKLVSNSLCVSICATSG
jgi:hypothetical protein